MGNVRGLAHYSYRVRTGGQAVVIDPRRDPDAYTEYAFHNHLKINHVLETHIHADYASGALELARATGVELWLSARDQGEDFQYAFPRRPFGAGEALRLDGMRLEALYTPGHTPEHLSFLLSDPAGGEYPVARAATCRSASTRCRAAARSACCAAAATAPAWLPACCCAPASPMWSA